MLFCLDMCMYILFMSGAQGSQNRALDPLELESWKIVSHHVYSGTQTWVFTRAASALAVKHLSGPLWDSLSSVHSPTMPQNLALIPRTIQILLFMCIRISSKHV